GTSCGTGIRCRPRRRRSGCGRQVGCGVMRSENSSTLEHLDQTLTTIEKIMDPEELSARVRELEAQATEPSLWDNPDHAQQVTSELSSVQSQLRKLRDLRQRLSDLPVMYELAEDEEGGEELADAELADLKREVEAL